MQATSALALVFQAARIGDDRQLVTLLKRASDPQALVVQRGPDDIIALHVATSARCMELLLRVGRAEEQILAVDVFSFNALMRAASHGRKECLTFLLEQPHAKEQLEAVCKEGMTALMLACQDGHASIVEALLAACDGALAATQCRAADK